jgi:hypothetical protein
MTGGKTSRDKGANYERKLARWIVERLGVEARRHRGGFSGDDIEHELPFISFEAKNRNENRLGQWVDQANAQARIGQIPVVVHHRTGKGSISDDFFTLDGDGFAALLGLALMAWNDVDDEGALAVARFYSKDLVS